MLTPVSDSADQCALSVVRLVRFSLGREIRDCEKSVQALTG